MTQQEARIKIVKRLLEFPADEWTISENHDFFTIVICDIDFRLDASHWPEVALIMKDSRAVITSRDVRELLCELLDKVSSYYLEVIYPESNHLQQIAEKITI